MDKISLTNNYLTFKFLDDILLLPREDSINRLKEACIVRIGPLVELTLFDQFLFSAGFATATANETCGLKRFLNQNVNNSDSLRARKFEFLRCPTTPEAFNNFPWIAACKRFESAAEMAGLGSKFAKALTGTFREMVENVFEHSENPQSAILGYKWSSGEFEYVVGDNGIGVLESLKRNPEYDYLLDSGQALRTAIANGESRFGKSAKRGNGFRELLLNIASRNSYLRFRSGEYSYILNGTNLSANSGTFQMAEFKGFLISIVCRKNKS